MPRAKPGTNARRLGCGRAAALAIMLCCGCLPDSFLITPVASRQELVETRVIEETWLGLGPKIAMIDVDGVLVNAEEWSLLGAGEHPVSMLLEKLDMAADDHLVKAVLLRINSPGGSVTASEMMYNEVRSFRARTGKPVVAIMTDVAASGGYYIACACDEILAHKSSVTGSIGVVLQLFDLTGTMAKIGVTPHTIKSGDLKAAGSPFERFTNRERETFQLMIDQMHEQFVGVVAAGRPEMSEARVRELADGRVYTAPQALDNGLIDGITTMRDAVVAVKRRIGLRRADVVAYHRPLGYVGNVYAQTRDAGRHGRRMSLHVQIPPLAAMQQARFMYLWAP